MTSNDFKNVSDITGEMMANRWAEKADFKDLQALIADRVARADGYMVEKYGVSLADSGLKSADVCRVIKTQACPRTCDDPLRKCPTGGIIAYVSKTKDGDMCVIEEYCPVWLSAKRVSGTKDYEHRQGNIKTGF